MLNDRPSSRIKTILRIVFVSLPFLLSAACGPVSDTSRPPPETSLDGPDTDATAPENAPPGTCWAKTVSPAVIETTTKRVLISPADVSEDGTIRAPARYRNEDSQRVVTPRQVTWTETLCPEEFTPAFTSDLQRALSARGFYTGPVTGRLGDATMDAVEAYQASQGIQARDLTREGAEKLGLVVVRPL